MKNSKDQIYFILKKISAENFEKSMSFLNPQEKERAANFQSEKRKKEFCIGRALLRETALSLDPSLQISNLEITEGPYGKPYFKDLSHLYFNLSHNNDSLVLLLSNFGEVGVDLENTQRVAALNTRKWLSPQEQNWSQEQALKLAFLWTRKEAYSKALGGGLRLDFSTLDVRSSEQKDFHLASFSNQKEVLSLCLKKPLEQIQVRGDFLNYSSLKWTD